MKKTFAILTAVILLLVASGCSGSDHKAASYSVKTPGNPVESGIVAENNDYLLRWDSTKNAVLLEHRASGKIWSNIPYDFYRQNGENALLNSTLNITVAERKTLQWSDAFSSLEAGTAFAEQINAGIRVTYCFDRYEISVPVEYTLRGDSLKVTVIAEQITEGEKYALVSVSPSPNLCSVKNTADEGYLTVPCGSGALMYPWESEDGVREYRGEVYGTDAARPITQSAFEEEKLRLPIFGVKENGDAIVGIIEDNAEAASIFASAGDGNTGFSEIGVTFYVRGYDVFDGASYKGIKNDLTRASRDLVTRNCSVGFYPLFGDKANYGGMAERYREYLSENDTLVLSDSQSVSPYEITLLGGLKLTDSILGIPVKKTETMTDLSQALNITEEIYDHTGIPFTLRTQGFGCGGICIDRLAGGFSFGKNVGEKRDWLKLRDYCQEKAIALYNDYDLIRFNRSGNGFSRNGNCAKTAILKTAEQCLVKEPLRKLDQNNVYRFLSKEQFGKAVNHLLRSTDQDGVPGVSLTTLGEIAYSDFSSNRTAIKGNTGSDVMSCFEQLRDSGKTVSSGANAYAAAVADSVTGVPIGNGDYFSFDETVPLYQMVFSGTKPLYSDAVNLAVIPEKMCADALAFGTGLEYTLIAEYQARFREVYNEKIYGMLYGDQRESLVQTVINYAPVYRAVQGSRMTDFAWISSTVSKTTYENGITVYVNHSDTNADCPSDTLSAYGYEIEEGGKDA